MAAERLRGAAGAATGLPRQTPTRTRSRAPAPQGAAGAGQGGHGGARLAPQVSTVAGVPSPTSSPTSMGRDGLGVIVLWANWDLSNLALAGVTAPWCP